MNTSYSIFPIGSNALTLSFGHYINEELNDRIISLMNYLEDHPVAGILDIIPAYSSLTIVYDLPGVRQKIPAETPVFDWMKELIEGCLPDLGVSKSNPGRRVEVPVCYDVSLGPDLEFVASSNRLTANEVISIHASKTYRVYMIGFLPGFAYMASVDDRITTPRKLQPRTTVPAGSVGIAGEQTGIYPLASPGGWQLIGQTPVSLFDPSRKNPAFFRPGDEVQFYQISLEEFKQSKHEPPGY